VSSESKIIERIEVQSLNGQVVKGMKLSDSTYTVELDVSDLEPGNYVIVVNNKSAAQVVISQ
jgi:hypothetical protein